MELVIKSGGFSLTKDFYFEVFPLDRFVDSLTVMSTSLTGYAELKPMWEEDFVRVEMLELGHVAVTGKFTEYAPYKQSLEFGFETDQTSLTPFRDALRQLASS